MASVEHQQYDMFKETLVDNRTRSQKEADKARKTSQNLMFSQRDMAQFGVNANPLFSLSPKMLLPMMMEDPRTEEEIEADRMKEALRLTTPLFLLGEEATTTQAITAEAALPTKPLPVLQPTAILDRRRSSPPAPPGQFAVQHRFAPPSEEIPKREKVVWRPTPKPVVTSELAAEPAETNEIDPKNQAFSHLAVKTKAFELRDKGNALATTGLLFNLLLANIEAQSAEILETEINLALRIGQAAAEIHRARKAV